MILREIALPESEQEKLYKPLPRHPWTRIAKGSHLSGRASSSASVGSDVLVCADPWAVTSSWLDGQKLGNNIIRKLVTKI